MLISCGRPQGGEVGPAHVDACGQGRGVKNVVFCGRHKWMTPNKKEAEATDLAHA